MTCEATVAIVVDTVERKVKLDHDSETIPGFLSRVRAALVESEREGNSHRRLARHER